MLQKHQFKAKDFNVNDFTINNMKKTGLKGIANFFIVYFNSTDTHDILDINKTLKRVCFELLKKVYCIISWRSKCI